MGEEKDRIMSQIRRDVMLKTLEKSERLDGRKFDEFRPMSVQRNVITTAEGSALANIGGTKVLAAVKIDMATPFPDRPTEGVFISNAELLPTASPNFESGPPNEDCVELARVVDRSIRSAEIIDVKSFFVEEGKVLSLFLDLYVIDHLGNYTDTATLAATAALMNTKIPKVEDGKIIRGEYSHNLAPKSLPVSVTFNRIGDHWLADPTRDEEVVLESKITISTTEEHVCTLQKSKGYITRNELFDNIEIAFKRGNDIRNILNSGAD